MNEEMDENGTNKRDLETVKMDFLRRGVKLCIKTKTTNNEYLEGKKPIFVIIYFSMIRTKLI